MFLLALIAIAFLPLLIQSLQTSALNARVATASQMVSQQLDQVRAVAPFCTTLSAFDDAALPTRTDDRGTVFQPQRTVGACPTSYPGTVEVRAWVTEGAGTDPTAEAFTRVYVQAAAPPPATPPPATP